MMSVAIAVIGVIGNPHSILLLLGENILVI